MSDHSVAGSGRVRFEARWATGLFRGPDGRAKLIGANRCLEVTLTDTELRTRLLFPFSVLFGSMQLGFRQVIPLSRIVQVENARFFRWWHTVRVTFLSETGQQKCLELAFTGPLPQFGPGQVTRRDKFVTMLHNAITVN